jgi:hypothetical protein
MANVPYSYAVLIMLKGSIVGPLYGLAHDVHNFSLLDDIKTLPWMLQQSG